VLRRAGADRARGVVSTIRRTRDNAAVLELAGEVPVLVRVFDDEDGRWVLARGGIPVPYSEAAADAFLEWFAETRDDLEEGLRARPGGRGSTSPGARP
jgi:hypothetical protein